MTREATMLMEWDAIATALSLFVVEYGDDVDAMACVPVMQRVCACAGAVSGLIASSLLTEAACLGRLVNDIEMPDRHGL